MIILGFLNLIPHYLSPIRMHINESNILEILNKHPLVIAQLESDSKILVLSLRDPIKGSKKIMMNFEYNEIDAENRRLNERDRKRNKKGLRSKMIEPQVTKTNQDDVKKIIIINGEKVDCSDVSTQTYGYYSCLAETNTNNIDIESEDPEHKPYDKELIPRVELVSLHNDATKWRNFSKKNETFKYTSDAATMRNHILNQKVKNIKRVVESVKREGADMPIIIPKLREQMKEFKHIISTSTDNDEISNNGLKMIKMVELTFDKILSINKRTLYEMSLICDESEDIWIHFPPPTDSLKEL